MLHTRPVRPARLPALAWSSSRDSNRRRSWAAPQSPGLTGCPPTGTSCGAQPHPHKAVTTQAVLGSLPSFPGEPRGLWGFVSVSSEDRASQGMQRGCKVQHLEQEVSQSAVWCRDVRGGARQTGAVCHGRVLRGSVPSPPHSMPRACLTQALPQSCPSKPANSTQSGLCATGPTLGRALEG